MITESRTTDSTDFHSAEARLRFDAAVVAYKDAASAESLLALNLAAIPLIAAAAPIPDEIPFRTDWTPVDAPAAFAMDFDEIRVVAGRELDAEEISRLSGAVGYAFRQVICGESLSEPSVAYWRDGNGAIQATILDYYYDSTKTRRDDPDFGEAFTLARDYVFQGSPVRTTNRAGFGTKGTRLVQPILPCTLTFSVR